MAYIPYNPNPVARRVGDCAVRAVSKALGVDWEQAFLPNRSRQSEENLNRSMAPFLLTSKNFNLSCKQCF